MNKENIVTPLTGSILLMDDDELSSKTVSEILEELGYAVETVTRGEEAVNLYKTRKEEGRPFTAVILDIYQPEGIGGREAMKRLLEYDPDVKSIASSGLPGDSTMSDPVGYGFCAALPKPYDIRQMGLVLKRVVTESKQDN